MNCKKIRVSIQRGGDLEKSIERGWMGSLDVGKGHNADLCGYRGVYKEEYNDSQA